MAKERIQKKLAQEGIASRREIERMIEAERIQVNGKLATIGQSIGPRDQVKVDGRSIELEFAPPPTEVLLYHKPIDEIVARKDPEGRRTVFESIPEPSYGRWVAIGRLDINTSGLLLFTNNGELAHRLMHPSYEVSRGYAVRVLGHPEESVLKQLRKGVELEDGMASFDKIDEVGGEGVNRWFQVALKEGRNREVRRMWEAVGFTVSRLSRVHFDVIQLPRDLSRGEWRMATLGQTNALLERVELSAMTAQQITEYSDKHGAKKAKTNAKGQTPRRARRAAWQERAAADKSGYADSNSRGGKNRKDRRSDDDNVWSSGGRSGKPANQSESGKRGDSPYRGKARQQAESDGKPTNDARGGRPRNKAYAGKSKPKK